MVTTNAIDLYFKRLTANDLDELLILSNLKFTLFTELYSCSLTPKLYIQQAIDWINRQSICSKKQVKRYTDLKRWVLLANSYQYILNLFYPSSLSRKNNFIKDIKHSNYLVTYDINTLKEYWVYKLSELDFSSITTHDLLDYSRIATKLDLVEHLNLIEFNKVFDLEATYGYSNEQIELFYSLVSYFKEASQNLHTWTYSKYEWPLLYHSVSLWQSWQRCSSVGLDKASYLINKFFGIKEIHPLFINWIWVIPHKDIIMETDWLAQTDTQYIYPTDSLSHKVISAFKLLEIDINVSFEAAKSKYKQLIKLYHPDLNSANSHNYIKAQELNEAWAIIKHYFKN